MRIADFLYRKLGLNIFKAAPHLRTQKTEIQATTEVALESMELPTPINTSTTDVIHIGPRGGRYKVDANGRKIYVKASWSSPNPLIERKLSKIPIKYEEKAKIELIQTP